MSAVSGVIAPETADIWDGSPPGRGGRGTECPQQGRNHRKPGNRRCRALRSRDTPELSLFRNEHIVHQMFREARISPRSHGESHHRALRHHCAHGCHGTEGAKYRGSWWLIRVLCDEAEFEARQVAGAPPVKGVLVQNASGEGG